MVLASVDTVHRKLLKMGETPYYRTGIPVIMGSKTTPYYDDEMSYGELPSYRYEDVKVEQTDEQNNGSGLCEEALTESSIELQNFKYR